MIAGVDIVDYIMDDVPSERPARRIYARHDQYTHPIPKRFRFNPSSRQAVRRSRKNKLRVQRVPAALRTEAAELRSAKANLDRAYNQEQSVNILSSRCTGNKFNLPEIVAARARAERRYVNGLIRYGRATNQMSSEQARELQATFTCRKMADSGMSNDVYLLGMYPQELN